MKSPTALLKIFVSTFLIVVSATSHTNEQLMNSADDFEDTAYPSFLIDNKTEKCVIPLNHEVLNQHGLKPEHIYPLFENTNKKAELNNFETKENPSPTIPLCTSDTIKLVLSSFSDTAQYRPAVWGIIYGFGLYAGFCMGTHAIGYGYVMLFCYPVWAFLGPLPYQPF